MKGARADVRIRPRIRVLSGDVVVFGPGKADLLDAIRELGSIRDAAKALGMSYMRAWTLVRTMNRGFRDPVVTLERGGAAHGGAVLTETGRLVLGLYREMETASLRAMSPASRRLGRRLRRL
ncbi:MAG TPA: LysR family transcriptional regulator [Thermoanaerobaculia bacterium]|nr:LysR family transcriptional regulator [Thermoanaerobaculia bacterium]